MEIEPQQKLAVDTTMELDDDEICETCLRKYVKDREHLEVTWIGCDFDDCGKWYHSFC